MGLQVFLQSLHHGEDWPVPTADILRCFDGCPTTTGDGSLDLVFALDDSCTIYLDTDADTNTGIMVSRPCGNRKLYESLYAVMKLAHFILIVPGSDGFLVVDQQTLDHVPDEVVASLGEPVVLGSLADFLAWWSVE